MCFALIRLGYKGQLAYRIEIWAQLLSEIVAVLAKVLVWKSIFNQVGDTDGVTLDEMVTYSILSGALALSWDWTAMLNTVGGHLRTGDIASFMLKPISYPAWIITVEIGSLLSKSLFVTIPSMILMWALFGMVPPASTYAAIFFVLYSIIAFAMIFLIVTLGGIVAFWTVNTFSIEWFLRSIIIILSGGFVPLWFYPDAVGVVIQQLPFAWLSFYPIAVYLGKISDIEMIRYLVQGGAWIAVLLAISVMLWRSALKRIVVQGG